MPTLPKPPPSESITIDGKVFDVPLLSAMSAASLQPILAPTAARLFGILVHVAGSDDNLSLEKLTPEAMVGMVLGSAPAIAGALGDAFAQIKPADFAHVTRTLLGAATQDGIPLFAQEDSPFNTMFRGRMLALWKLLFFAVRVNYPDFFPAGAVTGAPPAEQGTPSATSSTSPGDGRSIG